MPALSTAILIPAMRGHLLRGLLASIRDATPEPHQVWVIGTPDVVNSIPDDDDTVVYEDHGGTWGKRLNYLFAQSTESYVFGGADDLRFHPGWLSAALKTMAEVDGVVMVNDLQSDFGTLPLVSRHYIETLGGTVDGPGTIFHDGYAHNFTERETVETAKARGRWAYCPESVVEHMHYLSGKAPHDKVYELGQSTWDLDIALYQSRAHLWESLVR